jgi:hypothetical protein
MAHDRPEIEAARDAFRAATIEFAGKFDAGVAKVEQDIVHLRAGRSPATPHAGR